MGSTTKMPSREGARYFGWATNDRGRFEKVEVTFPNDKMTQRWTGVIYRDWNHAETAVAALNRKLAG